MAVVTGGGGAKLFIVYVGVDNLAGHLRVSYVPIISIVMHMSC